MTKEICEQCSTDCTLNANCSRYPLLKVLATCTKDLKKLEHMPIYKLAELIEMNIKAGIIDLPEKEKREVLVKVYEVLESWKGHY